MCVLHTAVVCVQIYMESLILIVATHIDAINKFSHDQLLPREKLHIDAFKAYASGDLPAACGHWAKCTLDHPRGLVSSHEIQWHTCIICCNKL